MVEHFHYLQLPVLVSLVLEHLFDSNRFTSCDIRGFVHYPKGALPHSPLYSIIALRAQRRLLLRHRIQLSVELGYFFIDILVACLSLDPGVFSVILVFACEHLTNCTQFIRFSSIFWYFDGGISIEGRANICIG